MGVKDVGLSHSRPCIHEFALLEVLVVNQVWTLFSHGFMIDIVALRAFIASREVHFSLRHLDSQLCPPRDIFTSITCNK